MAENEMATALSTGNTKPVEKKKFRHFQLTLNYEDNDDINEAKKILDYKYHELRKYLIGLKYNYYLACLEKNKKGYYHYHIYIQFETPHKLSIKKIQGAHIEICRGNPMENIDYLKKDYEFLEEYGSPRLFQGGSATINQIKKAPLNSIGDLDMRYYNIINKIKNEPIQNQSIFNTKKHVIWLYDDTYLDTIKDINEYTLYHSDDKGNIIGLSEKIVIFKPALKTIKKLLNKYNNPIKTNKSNYFYPATITHIIFISDNLDDTEISKTYSNMIIKQIDNI